MKKIYLPMHFDSGNRGCEGITKGTTRILQSGDYHIKAYSRNMALDQSMGYETDLYKLGHHKFTEKLSIKFRKSLIRFMPGQKAWIMEHTYKDMIDDITAEKDNSVALLTGGDLFCYDYDEIVWLNDYLCDRGIKTVLWGCSIGEENLTHEKIETLKRLKTITARESKTADMLKNRLRLNNVYLFPDPAFVVEPVKISAPSYFKNKEIVGINLSNFVNGNVGLSTIFGKNIMGLLNYIIDKTDMDILLVPHVFWNKQDDREICRTIYKKFESTGRACLLDSEKLNYAQLRYIISLCRFFIGARTHAMISAYSSCVPSLALGYSVKSEGIAKDLGLPQQLVVNYKNLKSETQLTEAFQYLLDNEDEIRNTLNNIMPEYKQKAYGARAVIEGILG